MPNHQIDKIYAVNEQDIPLNDWLMFPRQEPASVMVWARVTSTEEKTPLFLIEKGLKVNQHVYLELLRKKLVPWMNAAVRKVELPSSRTGPHPTQPIFSKNDVRRIWQVLAKGIVASILSRFKPFLELAIWSTLESKACFSNHQSVKPLKHRLRTC